MKAKLAFIIEAALLTIVFFMVNIRSLIIWDLYPQTGDLSGEAWREVFIWLMALLMMSYLLKQRGAFKGYLLTWLDNRLLLIFVLFSLASVLWSDSWTVTLHRSLVFAFASISAVFLGLQYSVRRFLRVLYWVGAVVVVTSLVLVFLSPVLGTDLNPGYNGTWRGIFWHKNQLGNLLPIFSLVFLVCLFLFENKEALVERKLAVVFYLLSLVEIAFAKSASGYIVLLLLHFALGLFFLWLKIKHLLLPRHYYIALAFSIVAAVVILLNLDFVFGLFGREAHLTGRVPMWGILFREVFPQKPWFGQGFGTIWAELDFRLYMRDSAGWPYPIMISDNGFIDILLNLGIVGLALFLLYYVKAWIVSVQYFLREPSLEGFFPFIFMVYTLFVNLTFSLFMETEVFVWTVMVALAVVAARRSKSL